MMRTEGYGRDGTYTSTRFCCRRARRGCHFSNTYVERSNDGAEIVRNEDREEGRNDARLTSEAWTSPDPFAQALSECRS